MAGWQSGYAADCKSVYLGSTPGPASIVQIIARVAKLVDARDLKSLGGNTVPVRVRPRAPLLELVRILAGWQSGYAVDCKSVYLGSTPGLASIIQIIARVAKLVDARDLKSLGGNTVPVRVRPRAPFFTSFLYQIF